MSSNTIKRAVCLLAATTVIGYSLSALAGKGGKPGGNSGGDARTYDIIALADEADGVVYVDAYAADVNNLREVVGYVFDTDSGDAFAAYWKVSASGDQLQSTLHLLPWGFDCGAASVNDLGEIVGTGFDGQTWSGVYWAGPSDSNPLTLPPLPGDDKSRALAINADGIVCGSSTGSTSGRRAVAWRINLELIDDELTPTVWGPAVLPSPGESFASAVNDNVAGEAQIAGRFLANATANEPYAAVVWTVKSLGDGSLEVQSTELLAVDAWALGINNLGAVCGHTAQGAVVWSGDSSVTLPHSKFVFVPTAYDMNDGGVIVGDGVYSKGTSGTYRALVWPNKGSSEVLLDKYLTGNSPFHQLNAATAVNEFDEIVGSGTDSAIDFQGAYLAVPK